MKLQISHTLKRLLLTFLVFLVISECNIVLNANRTSCASLLNETESISDHAIFNPSIDEQEAIIMERVLIKTTKALQISIRITSTAIRVSADTISGLVGGLSKAFGGIFSMLASALWWTSGYVQWSSEPGLQFACLLNSTASLMSGAGDSCVWGGKIAETLTTGMGQAIQDSFRGLESFARAIESLVQFTFHPHFRKSSIGWTIHERVLERNGSNAATEDNFDIIIQQQNALYHRSRFHQSDQSPPETDSFSEAGTINTTLSMNPSVRGTSSSHISLLRRNHSITRGPKTPLDVRSKYKEASNLFDVSSSLSGALPYEERDDNDPYYTKASNFVSLLVSFSVVARQRVISSCQDAMRFAAELAASLTLSTEEVPAGPSIGPFLLLGLLLVSIVNLCEYSSVRGRFAVLLICSLVVWVCVVRVEREQRLRLVKSTTIRSLHSFLEQQKLDRVLNTSAVTNNSTAPYEHAIWLNVFLGALWTVDSAGGAGAFLNKMFEDAVSAELAQVPPSIASVRLKRFDLGSNAPLVRGIRVVSVSDAKCVADALAYRRSVHATESKNDQYAAGSAGLSGEDLLDTLHKLVSDASHRLRPRSSHSDRARGGGTNRFLSACGEVVLEMDFVFASRDMLVELSLRSADSQSVLPDLASATLSELLLAGQLRLAIQLTEDYPFLGNATASFLEPPTVDFTVSSFGGVDLSAIPLAFQWMNGTIHWMLEQYTHPLSMPVDLRHIICPDCDASAPLTTGEVLVETSQRIRRAVVRMAVVMEGIIARETVAASVVLTHLKSVWLKISLVIRHSTKNLRILPALRHFHHQYRVVGRILLDYVDFGSQSLPSVRLPADPAKTVDHDPPPPPSPHRGSNRWYSQLARRVLRVEDWTLEDFEEAFAH